MLHESGALLLHQTVNQVGGHLRVQMLVEHGHVAEQTLVALLPG